VNRSDISRVHPRGRPRARPGRPAGLVPPTDFRVSLVLCQGELEFPVAAFTPEGYRQAVTAARRVGTGSCRCCYWNLHHSHGGGRRILPAVKHRDTALAERARQTVAPKNLSAEDYRISRPRTPCSTPRRSPQAWKYQQRVNSSGHSTLRPH